MRKTARDQFKPEQYDHHEADGKYQGSDQRLTRCDRRAKCQAGGGAEQRTGQRAADQEILWRQRQFLQAGIDHRGNDVGRFCVIHIEAPVAMRRHGHNEKRVWIARKFDSKGSAVSEFRSDPISFVAAEIHPERDGPAGCYGG